MARIVWLSALSRKSPDDVQSVVVTALECGFDQIVVPGRDRSLDTLGRFSAILRKDDLFLLGDMEIGRSVTIQSPKDESFARGLRGKTPHVIVRMKDWKMIPLENLIAHFQGSGTRLLVEVHDAAEAKRVFETMEIGVDGILLTTSSLAEIRAVRAIMDSESRRVSLTIGQIASIRPVGLGDRVCVDTCSLLRMGEGLLVGNSSTGLFLIHAETFETGYVAARPFRVNAGPVHAYVYLPDGRTKYLSELGSGDEVLAVDSEGRARSVVVGRLKIERRPLVLIEAEANDRRFTTIVQNAETIRLVTPAGGAVSVGDLKEGDEVLLRLEEGGRHTGMRIQETISER
jgi:3-dehydroquinate synthase II